MTSGREYSDETAKLIDNEIARILLEQESRATDLLGKHRAALDSVAGLLLEKETIDAADVARLIQGSMDVDSPAPDDASASASLEQ